MVLLTAKKNVISRLSFTVGSSERGVGNSWAFTGSRRVYVTLGVRTGASVGTQELEQGHLLIYPWKGKAALLLASNVL